MWTTHTILYSVTGGSSQATTPTSPTPPRQHDSGRYSVVSEQLGTRPLAGTSPFLAGYSEARQRLSERQQHYHRPAGTVREPSFIAWAVGKVQGAIQASVICFVAVCMFPLVVAGAVLTLLASVMVHYLMSGYNVFNDGVSQPSTHAAEYAPPRRFRWARVPGGLTSAWDSDYSSSSDEEDQGTSSRASRRVHRLRTRIGARMTDLHRRLAGRRHASPDGSTGEGPDSSDTEGSNRLRQTPRHSQAWAARMRRMRSTFQASVGSLRRTASYNSSSESEPPSPSGFALPQRKSVKDLLQLVLKDEGFLYGLLSELPGVDVTSVPIQNAIERMRDDSMRG